MSASPSITSNEDSESTPLVAREVEVSETQPLSLQQQQQQQQQQQPSQTQQRSVIGVSASTYSSTTNSITSNTNTNTNNNNSNSNNYNSNFYFLNDSVTNANQPSDLKRLGQHVIEHEIEHLPKGATEDEFASRPVMGAAGLPTSNPSSERGLFSMIFGSKTPNGFQPTVGIDGDGVGVGEQSQSPISLSPMMKKRQAAIKIEPKVFFSNERTFLAWLHSAVLLAGASIALTSKYSHHNNASLANQLYGIVLLPVAIAFMVYAMHQYGRRSQMIRRRAPGPYEDIIGPSVLAVALMLSIVTQFSLKLYTTLTYSRNVKVVAEVVVGNSTGN